MESFILASQGAQLSHYAALLRMFSCPKILFLVSLLFVALLNSIPTYLFDFLSKLYV